MFPRGNYLGLANKDLDLRQARRRSVTSLRYQTMILCYYCDGITNGGQYPTAGYTLLQWSIPIRKKRGKGTSLQSPRRQCRALAPIVSIHANATCALVSFQRQPCGRSRGPNWLKVDSNVTSEDHPPLHSNPPPKHARKIFGP